MDPAGIPAVLPPCPANDDWPPWPLPLAGGPRVLRIFMSRSAVRATFTVVPTTFQEEVKFVVNVEFITQVSSGRHGRSQQGRLLPCWLLEGERCKCVVSRRCRRMDKMDGVGCGSNGVRCGFQGV